MVMNILNRFDDGAGGDNEVQRTMLELINQLDGFDPRGNIKVNNLQYRIFRRKATSTDYFVCLTVRYNGCFLRGFISSGNLLNLNILNNEKNIIGS